MLGKKKSMYDKQNPTIEEQQEKFDKYVKDLESQDINVDSKDIDEMKNLISTGNRDEMNIKLLKIKQSLLYKRGELSIEQQDKLNNKLKSVNELSNFNFRKKVRVLDWVE